VTHHNLGGESVNMDTIVQAQFRVIEKAEVEAYGNSGGGGGGSSGKPINWRLKLAAVRGEPFGSATPQGTIEMLITNPTAAERLQVGQAYLLTFEPVGVTARA
jgi:hypothetical protein